MKIVDAVTWKPIEITDQTEINQFLMASAYPISDYNFTHLMIWQEAYHLEFAKMSTFLVIRGMDLQSGKAFMYMPLGKGNFSDVIEVMMKEFEKCGDPLQIRAVTPSMIRILTKNNSIPFEYRTERNDYEYLYKIESLANYSDKALRRKREMCRYFEARYAYKFVPYTSDEFHRLKPLLNYWYGEAEDDPVLWGERNGIIRILNDFDRFECNGYMVIIQEEMVGFILVEALTPSTLVVHFEKGNREFKGVYDMMKRDVCRLYRSTFEKVNLEEDMGLSGLRMAKGLYKPNELVEKGMLLFGKSEMKGAESL